MIVQFSTGGRGRDPGQRGSALYLRPDMASLSTGSVNFPTIVYENPLTLVEEIATTMKEYAVFRRSRCSICRICMAPGVSPTPA